MNDVDFTSRIKQLVSFDQWELIQEYVRILLKWNDKINLVTRRETRKQIYYHIIDALMIAKCLSLSGSHTSQILDVGSGAGFMGVILSILGYNNCCLIEKNGKKATFLLGVISALGICAYIFDVDVRNFCYQLMPSTMFQLNKGEKDQSYIISKAVASVPTLLDMCCHLITPHSTFLFLKNEAQIHEVESLKGCWHFDLRQYQNIYKQNSIILEIRNLKRIL
ncbi:Ribosomal RNA small subunit methyltransferase G [Alphaproteobacteria bacterium]